jgi:ParB family chromosome partitioning protein
MSSENVDPRSIVVPAGRRALGDRTALRESMRLFGKVLQPIGIKPNRELVWGAHRLATAIELGWSEIAAIVVSVDSERVERCMEATGRDADEVLEDFLVIAEIDENIRNPLTVLEQSNGLATRKSAYERLHPETKNGGDRKSLDIKTKPFRSDPAPTFAEDTAAKTGLSPRSIQHGVQIATAIAPEVKEALRGTELADNKRGLLDLARKSPDEQRAVAADAVVAPKSSKAKVPPADPRKERRERLHAVCGLILHAESQQTLDAAYAAASRLTPQLDPDEAEQVAAAYRESNQRIAAKPALPPPDPRQLPIHVPDAFAPMAAMMWARKALKFEKEFARGWAALLAERPAQIATDADARAAFESVATRILQKILAELPDDAQPEARRFGVITGGRA